MRTTELELELERFEKHTEHDPVTACILWTGAKNPKGYGQFSVRRSPAERACCPRGGNKRVQAHKWLYEYHHGKVGRGMEVDHKCCNPGCVNLTHLQKITKSQNLALRGKIHLNSPQDQANL